MSSNARRQRTSKGKTFLSLTRLLLASLVVGLLSCADKDAMDVTAGAQLVSGADYVGQESCAMCHAERTREFEWTLHSKMQVPAADNQELDLICEGCHGPGSLHLEAGGGRGVYIVNPVENVQACFQCHTSISARFLLLNCHPVRRGKMNCADCHNPHGRNIFTASGSVGIKGRQVCSQCHANQTGPHVFEHEALREGCVLCHQPHASINEKLLVERDNNLCLRCHGQIASFGSVVIGDVPHTARVAQGVCWSSGCHTAVHGSNINAHLRY
jgi:predicted CXXCH cytochrome family protein